jgi:type I restriction-modification system DNA methylase subunit
MANEELHQRGYVGPDGLAGRKFGEFEELNIGSTTANELKRVGLDVVIPDKVDYPFCRYKPLKKPGGVKPDRVFMRREGASLYAVAVAEHKAPSKLRTQAQTETAAEQGLFQAAVLGARIAIVHSKDAHAYVDVKASLAAGQLVYLEVTGPLNGATLGDLLRGQLGKVKDPAPLAETAWQKIWQATKEEPKQCLLTFVEIFVLKFLSDNLPTKVLPKAYRFETLTGDPKVFFDQHGKTAIEYYVETVRPFIKTLFPDNTVAGDQAVANTFGLETVVSKTSVINGFAFLRSSQEALSGFNRTFLDILRDFEKFGALTAIDPEFKLRLYETFLRRSARQQKLGQFFTPRNVVRPMIRMARLGSLPDGAVILDPAAGVGGFVLEPPLIEGALAKNVRFEAGRPVRRLKLIGADVDANTHILAKANTLIHFAEAVRDPATTVGALNKLMAETFVLMNENETLGSLANPPQECVDVILTNPPYVTKGSAVYKEELKEHGTSSNGTDLREHYDQAGLGVESLFLRYIARALKPGGRAFVIVPLGLLNRTEPTPKRRLLEDCNLLASISLPRNTFFNTAQLTFVLVLEKRHTEVDPRPDVFCGIARTIGETLNWERVPTPEDNDLGALADLFIAWSNGDRSGVDQSPIAKLEKPEDFTENDRWDVGRFWSEGELVALGQKESAVERVDYIDETVDELAELTAELNAARGELKALITHERQKVKLSDTNAFAVRSGTRITGKQIRENEGQLPIYSCFKTEREVKGFVLADFFTRPKSKGGCGGCVEEGPIVTVNANGASVGRVYVRRDRCGITDDVIVVEVRDADLDVDYVATALQAAVDKGGYLYEAKLFVTRVRELEVDIPVTKEERFDVDQQRAIASAVKRFDALRTRLSDLGARADAVRTI